MIRIFLPAALRLDPATAQTVLPVVYALWKEKPRCGRDHWYFARLRCYVEPVLGMCASK